MTRKQKLSVALPILLSILLVAGCATMGTPSNVTAVTCGAKSITWDVTKDASVSNFTCTLGRHEGEPALIFTMDLTNTTGSPHRYRVNIFLEDMDKAFGHLVPRTGKPPLVAPGQTAGVKLPFMKTETLSDKVHVVVNTMSE